MSRQQKFAAATLVLAASMAVLAGCGSDGSSGGDADQPAMEGRLAAPECAGGWELENSQVTLRNASDEIIGTANTSANLVAPLTSPCVVEFAIGEVPDANFYTIKIGTHEGPAWSADEMEDMDFDPELSLGDAEMPDADPAAFCSTVDDFTSVLDDVDLLNKNSFRWSDQVHALPGPFRTFAAGLILEGEDEDARAVLAVADSLKKIDGWLAAKPLTQRLETANMELPALTSSYDCSYWTEQGYRAG